MIDEPTNHLDGPGRALVSEYRCIILADLWPIKPRSGRRPEFLVACLVFSTLSDQPEVRFAACSSRRISPFYDRRAHQPSGRPGPGAGVGVPP